MTTWWEITGWFMTVVAAVMAIGTVLIVLALVYGWVSRRRYARRRRACAARERAAVERLSSRPHGRRVVALAVERERRRGCEKSVAGS